MTNIKLIIQKNGIEFLYGKQLIDKSSSIKETLSDEREIGQIAHKSGFYSLFVSKSYKVYSFINSNVYDQANRESVLSYRLYVDGDKKILNIKKIFEQISLKFENYIKEGNVSNQNYDDILNSIKTVDHNKDSIVGNVLQNSYYLYFSENENLDDIISEEENKLVKKFASRKENLVTKTLQENEKLNNTICDYTLKTINDKLQSPTIQYPVIILILFLIYPFLRLVVRVISFIGLALFEL